MSEAASAFASDLSAPDEAALAPRAAVWAGPAVAVLTLIAAIVVCDAAGVPLRDPDGVASGRLGVALLLITGLVGLDIAVRASRISPGVLPTREALSEVRRERWNRHRAVPVALAVLSFFLTYFAYRNLKSVVPVLRPDVLYDAQLDRIDRAIFGGEAPASALHAILGTGVSAHALSGVYVLLFAFIPISLSIALVFSPNLETGLFYSTALALNWGLAAASYFLLPSIGPFHDLPGTFAELPVTAVTQLQDLLVTQRDAFVQNPGVPGSAQSIGAFASLHVSIYATAAFACHLLRLSRRIKVVVWALTALTVIATIYFGWHYLMDDVAGLLIAAVSLEAARRISHVRLPSRAAST